ncbi:capsule biosynthesis protein [Clostridia bacterium]|nr:capsule biosynthesis protein [Clostridia bacterium]GHV31597.1 capsule biosynthesis protein [Clostridia bacterium]
MKKLLLSAALLLLLTACAFGGDIEDGGRVSFNPIPSVSQSPPPSETPTPTPTPTPPPTPTPTPNPAARIQMAGDILLHGYLLNAAKVGDSYDFVPYWADIKPYIDGDLSICNMEGPVDAFGGNEKISTYPRFNAPIEILDALKYAGFDALVTANNHAYDRAFDGLVKSRENLENAGFLVTGTNGTQEQYDEYLIVDLNGVKVGLIAYSELDNGLGGIIPEEKRKFAMRKFNIGTADVEKMAADMAECRKQGADMIILSLHWGVEYANKPGDAAVAMARALAENGADVVMGNHSHCVQPIEWTETTRGKRLIIYSLGNFFVDQNALEPPIPRTQFGMLVTVSAEINKGELSLAAEYLPTFMRKYSEGGVRKYSLMPAVEGDDVTGAAYEHVTKIVGDISSG